MHKIFSIALFLLLSAGSFGNADTTAPRTSIVSPDTREVARSGVWNIEVLASDSGSGGVHRGVETVRMQVVRLLDDGQRLYWNGEEYQTQPFWNRLTFPGIPALPQNHWLLSDVDLTVDGLYVLRVAALDVAGNLRNTKYTLRTAGAIDTVAPHASFDSIDAFATFRNGFYDVPGLFTYAGVRDLEGDAFDNGFFGSGTDWVRVQVCRDIDGQRDFWDGFKYQSQPRWVEAMLGNRRWLLPDVDFTTEGSYCVRFTNQDHAGNRVAPADHGIYFIETVVDNTKPYGTFIALDRSEVEFSETVLNPYRILRPGQPPEQPGHVLRASTRRRRIRIRVDDQFGTIDDIVYFQIYHVDSGEYYDGSRWQSTQIWSEAEISTSEVDNSTIFDLEHYLEAEFRSDYLGTGDFSRPGDYWVRMQVRDLSGNVSSAAENDRILVRVAPERPDVPDTTAPTAYTVGNISSIVEPDGTLLTPGKTAVAAEQNITGFASDTGTGVEGVFVQVERRSGGTVTYWSGGNFRDRLNWVEVETNTGLSAVEVPWSLNNVDLTTPGVYVVRLSPFDVSGNRSTARQNPVSFFVVE